jgi:hypothetical protein
MTTKGRSEMTAKDYELADVLGAMKPHIGLGAAEPSEARQYLRDNFDTISTARDRGRTWLQITRAIVESSGVRAADGSALEWRVLKSLFHAERYSRGVKRKHRPKRPPTPADPKLTQTLIDAPENEPSRKFVLPKARKN